MCEVSIVMYVLTTCTGWHYVEGMLYSQETFYKLLHFNAQKASQFFISVLKNLSVKKVVKAKLKQLMPYLPFKHLTLFYLFLSLFKIYCKCSFRQDTLKDDLIMEITCEGINLS